MTIYHLPTTSPPFNLFINRHNLLICPQRTTPTRNKYKKHQFIINTNLRETIEKLKRELRLLREQTSTKEKKLINGIERRKGVIENIKAENEELKSQIAFYEKLRLDKRKEEMIKGFNEREQEASEESEESEEESEVHVPRNIDNQNVKSLSKGNFLIHFQYTFDGSFQQNLIPIYSQKVLSETK